MSVCRWLVAGMVAVAALGADGAAGPSSVTDPAGPRPAVAWAGWGSPLAAQEVAFKAGIAVSNLAGDTDYWDERITTTLFGIHVRFDFGPIALQPELFMVTRGAATSTAPEEEQIRLEYIDLPVLLVVPFQVGAAEPYVFGGPSLSLESRCRWQFREGGLRTNVGCEPRPHPEVFPRPSVDFGAIGGAGLAYPLGPGRLLVEGRHSWGLRNIAEDGRTLKNRTFLFMLGYTLDWAGS